MLIPFKEMFPRQGIDDVTGIMHIGAHLGEESAAYEELGIKDVIWVEADPITYKKLLKLVPIYNRTMNAAVSDKRGKVTFHRANNNQSSSLLELGTHEFEHPEVHYVDSFTVNAITMDDVANSQGMKGIVYKLGSASPRTTGRRLNINMLNLDIQGAELMALNGGEETLKHIKYIYTEVNIRELYKGCALMPQLDEFLGDRGFKRVETIMMPQGWGDAIYVKS